MANPRTAGVLMHVTSLPSPFGCGVFGTETKAWIDRLADMEFRWWQVLPFNPLDASHSPYASPSAFAGNDLFIDPRLLEEEGLVTQSEAEACVYSGSPYTADYEFALRTRRILLRQAFAAWQGGTDPGFSAFLEENAWVRPYAQYQALKEKNDRLPWWEWPREEADYAQFQKKGKEADGPEVLFWEFTQYKFFQQWEQIKQYAHQKGIGIFGDMPIYVSMDSVDVWSHPDLFCIDPDTLRPSQVSGVPPDYFAKDGQLWGNPLYDWSAMKQDGYQWWLERIGSALSTFDRVRIDHFRAFASYWAVPAGAATAREGQWKQGPGQALFDRVEQRYPHPDIVAEDLGLFGQDVVDLLESTGFPGMRVVQFGFDPGADSSHLPHHYPFHSLAYLGTHDNNTLLGWLWEASEEERAFALEYCGFTGAHWGDGGFQSPSCRKIIETVWRSAAQTAMISFQDLCGFGSDARMNIPGVPEKNWRFRTTRETMEQIDTEYYRKINRLFRRTAPLSFPQK